MAPLQDRRSSSLERGFVLSNLCSTRSMPRSFELDWRVSEAGLQLKLKLDLHVHTSRSSDAFTSPEGLPAICRDRGLDGLAITDHNVLARDSDDELIILPGIEISTRDGHLIGLRMSETIPRGLSAVETI